MGYKKNIPSVVAAETVAQLDHLRVVLVVPAAPTGLQTDWDQVADLRNATMQNRKALLETVMEWLAELVLRSILIIMIAIGPLTPRLGIIMM